VETQAPAQRRSSRVATIVKLALAVAAAVSLILFGREVGSEVLPRFEAWVQGLGPWAPLAFILGYAVAAVAFIPGSALTLAAGVIFGFVRGTMYAFTGAFLGSAAAFLVARYGARRWVEKKLASQPKFSAIDRAVGAEGGKIVALLRLAPVFPFNLLNYALGLTSVRLGPYLLASFAMLPGTALYVYLGKVGKDAAAGGKSPAQWVLLAVGLVALVAVTTLITRMARKALGAAVSEENASAPTEPTPSQATPSQR
jgi:uncharacterized membrane protein YdjX (TVP38/TMEM64 family)